MGHATSVAAGRGGGQGWDWGSGTQQARLVVMGSGTHCVTVSRTELQSALQLQQGEAVNDAPTAQRPSSSPPLLPRTP